MKKIPIVLFCALFPAAFSSAATYDGGQAGAISTTISMNVSGFSSVKSGNKSLVITTKPGETVNVIGNSSEGYLTARNIVLPPALINGSSGFGEGTLENPFKISYLIVEETKNEIPLQSKIINTELDFVRNFYSGSSWSVDESPRRITLGNKTIDTVIVTSALDEQPVYYCFDVTEYVNR